MDDVFKWFIAIFVAISAAMMVNIGFSDYRNFDHLIKACQTTGHVQDTKTRIICAIEKPVDRN